MTYCYFCGDNYQEIKKYDTGCCSSQGHVFVCPNPKDHKSDVSEKLKQAREKYEKRKYEFRGLAGG